MNVQEMHLAIQQGVDKINSLQADMLLPQEIDIELNKSQIRFINTKYSGNNRHRTGFEESQKRIDDLRTLLREFEAPVTFKEQLRNNIFVDTFTLPVDYMYLVNQQSTVWIDDCNPMNWNIIYPDPINYFTMSLSDFVCDKSTQIADSIVMYEDASDLTLGQALLWSNTTPLLFPADVGQLLQEITSNAGPGFTVFWEQFMTLNHPGEFIVVVDTSVHSWFQWDASVGTVSTLVALDNTGTNLESTRALNSGIAFNEKRDPTDFSERLMVSNTFIQQDDIFTMLQDPFNTTKHTDPLTTIRGNEIDIYTSDIFIIDTVKITYIRNPRNISLPLGIDCELPEHSHQEIVDMTVSSILEGISDPRYKTHQVEVSRNE
jgi:hypothetical protein